MASLPDRNPIVETALWLGLLRACSGMEPFLKRHQGTITARTVAAFLILEPRFPRSVRYCVRAAYKRLGRIRPPGDHDLPGGQSLERLRVLDGWLVEPREGALDPGGVHELLTHVVDETAAIGETIGRELLGHADEEQEQRQEQGADRQEDPA